MRPRALALLVLLLAACRGPWTAFDAGHDVHFILAVSPKPNQPLPVEPVCTVGTEIARSEERILGGGGPGAAEVAVFHVPSGPHSLSLYDPRTGVRAAQVVGVDHEMWIVVGIVPGRPEATLDLYRQPPHEPVGPWDPLVVIPD